ncbi:sulfatase modifying factor 1 [Schizosaccharomyces japonicus yFS275]|uniref:Sulfatase modifying factor 1 n=1 Tax=Schizosaccharomyces japonicus (strain yFS275 / FY16936) TaxID=402676 RepID=B6JWQ3_SCHJY|nr:sulfatase modifying factor 1 [Schizosaccharomyces japonicus yFS275]EEB05804.1 sulfatase modifying factor 1 [Schizosaccharomyces japonicus yFS275]
MMAESIIDIGATADIFSAQSVSANLKQSRLSSSLLYDETGLQLFGQITQEDEYYPFRLEMQLLQKHADWIAEHVRSKTSTTIILELGCGSMRKTKVLLDAFENTCSPVHYYALDLNRKELQNSLNTLEASTSYRNVKISGICGCFKHALSYLPILRSSPNSKFVLTYLGSSIGNFSREESATFLQAFSSKLKPDDQIIVSFDHRHEKETIISAYNDKHHITEKFELNILNHVNHIFGARLFHLDDWRYQGEYDEHTGVHKAFLISKRPVTIPELQLSFPQNHKLLCEESWKSSSEEANKILHNGGFFTEAELKSNHGFSLFIASVPTFDVSRNPETPCPTLEEWTQIRLAWLYLVFKLYPRDLYFTELIPVRHPFIFYIGHVPAFNDIYLARLTDGKPTLGRKDYWDWFQRGIDPDLDNTKKCHWHSQPPEKWPSVEEVNEYERNVWSRLVSIYKQGEMSANMQRAMWMIYEHTAMHLETSYYILLQSDYHIISPNNFPPPIAPALQTDPTWVRVPESFITMGIPTTADGKETFYYGWDNEKPERQVSVRCFEIANRPISNGEYLSFLKETTQSKEEFEAAIPKTWLLKDEMLFAKSMYGPLPIEHVLGWPVATSYDELKQYANAKGCRLPTDYELRAFYDHVLKPNEETYVDTAGYATAFQQWYPKSLQDEEKPQIYTGLWEWTSTVLKEDLDFTPEELYPDYTRDFFDGKHNVVMGGSFTTVARIANRRSFRNFYQRKYPYAWIGARLVKVTNTLS